MCCLPATSFQGNDPDADSVMHVRAENTAVFRVKLCSVGVNGIASNRKSICSCSCSINVYIKRVFKKQRFVVFFCSLFIGNFLVRMCVKPVSK